TFTDSDRSGSSSGYAATIDWGDGTTSSGVVTYHGDGAISVAGTHTYTTTAQKAVRVTLADLEDGAASVTADSTATTSGTAQGDVHFVDFFGEPYDFHGIGTFTLARSDNPLSPFDVEIDTSQYLAIPGTSVVTGVTVQIGENNLEFLLDG